MGRFLGWVTRTMCGLRGHQYREDGTYRRMCARCGNYQMVMEKRGAGPGEIRYFWKSINR